MNIFIDTSAFFAIVDSGDENHTRAAQAWEELIRQEHILVVNNYILLETIALLQRRIGIDAVRDFERSVIPELYIDWLGKAEHEAAFKMLLIAGSRRLSLVDCSSFDTMARFNINNVFTFDSHFAERNYDCIP